MINRKVYRKHLTNREDGIEGWQGKRGWVGFVFHHEKKEDKKKITTAAKHQYFSYRNFKVNKT